MKLKKIKKYPTLVVGSQDCAFIYQFLMLKSKKTNIFHVNKHLTNPIILCSNLVLGCKMIKEMTKIKKYTVWNT